MTNQSVNDGKFSEAELAKIYERSQDSFEIASRHLVHIVEEVFAVTEEQGLARAKLADRPRIKALDSLAAKARRNGWMTSEVLSRCPDTIGIRVVCNNVSDAYRFVDLLEKRLAQEQGGPVFDLPLSVEVEDHITAPTQDGYRAIHVKFGLTAADGRFGSVRVGCEVQVRTLLQDGWARLSHIDAYKTDDLPEDLRARFRDLSKVLDAADGIAQDIRDRIAAVRPAPDHRPDLGRVTEDGVAYLFASSFGRSPPDYILRAVIEAFQQNGVQTLDGFEKLLSDKGVRARIERAYLKGFHGRARPSPEDVFFFTAVAASKGPKEAFKESRRRGKAEWDYVDTVWRSEVGAQLPLEPEQFVKELEAGHLSVEQLAEQFGARSDCAICGEDIIDPEVFEEGASNHYRGYDFEGRVAGHIYGCGVETGGFKNSSLCSYHDNALSKDD
jgi:ppGpp synthetase/RelA/SpoT-type nucleotidyltranferase